jgi:hypothetical protein
MFSVCFFKNTKHFSKSLPNNFFEWTPQKSLFKCRSHQKHFTTFCHIKNFFKSKNQKQFLKCLTNIALVFTRGILLCLIKVFITYQNIWWIIWSSTLNIKESSPWLGQPNRLQLCDTWQRHHKYGGMIRRWLYCVLRFCDFDCQMNLSKDFSSIYSFDIWWVSLDHFPQCFTDLSSTGTGTYCRAWNWGSSKSFHLWQCLLLLECRMDVTLFGHMIFILVGITASQFLPGFSFPNQEVQILWWYVYI